MSKRKRRGRERLVICASCGRRVPRDKSVRYDKRVSYSTEMNTKDDIKSTMLVEAYYCISCGKHRRIFEKKKSIAQRRRDAE